MQYTLFRETKTETAPDGTTTTTVTETTRVTYGQPSWARYNAAQTSEKDHFCRLAHDLVASVPTPEQKGRGNRRLSRPDALFASLYKVYSGFSGRRFMSDMRSANDAGLTERAVSFSAIFDTMQSEEITPILHDLVETTAKPLASVETQFAIDSTGLGTACFYHHFSSKYGKDKERRAFVKLHALVGTKTNVIAACKITDASGGDSVEFRPLLASAKDSFNIQEISADKAYSSYANLEYAEHIGAKPYVPFKSSATANTKSHKGGSKTWTRLFHFFQMNKEEFLPHYHRRSNSETTFSMVKRCIADTLRSKTQTAQINEALLVVICHNIRCLIHEAYEMGFEPMLAPMPCTPEAAVACQNVAS